jgi:long-chain acyl-CoA synthetase
LLPAAIRSSNCEHVIGIDPMPGIGQSGDVDFLEWRQLIADEEPDVAGCAARATAKREDLACIIYTSAPAGRRAG